VTFVVANNHNLGKAAVNALELAHMLTGGKSCCARTARGELSQTSENRGRPGHAEHFGSPRKSPHNKQNRDEG